MDIRKFLALAAVLMAAGCAQVPPDAGQNPVDPHERVNRHIYAFNSAIDSAVLKPVAQAYVDWTPSFVQEGVSNAAGNLFEPSYALNNMLQGKVDDGMESGFRFLVNTTFGIFGLFDVAGWIGMDPHPEDFGQTLGKWGVPSGSYWVLPFLGPSTPRDAAGYIERFATNPTTYALWNQHWAWGVGSSAIILVDGRAQLLRLEDMRAAAVDEYAAVRDAYLRTRERAVRDGAVLSEEEELETLTPLDFGDDDEGSKEE